MVKNYEVIKKNQINIIKKVNLYLKTCRKDGINIGLSPFCFNTAWADSMGYAKLLRLVKGYNLNSILIYLKNFIGIGFHHNYTLLNSSAEFVGNNHKSLIVSWCKKKNFSSDGEYQDNYINLNSKFSKNLIWFLISVDNFEPKKIKGNINILIKKKKSFSILFLFRKVIDIALQNKFSIRKIYHYLSVQYIFSDIVNKHILNLIRKKNFKNVVMPYEGQPYQNRIFYLSKKNIKNINNFAYLHCAPWPIQVDLINKHVPIDKFYVSGDTQRKVLIRNYGWSPKKIFSIPSLRYNLKNVKDYSKFIFLPYRLSNNKRMVEKFEKFLKTIPAKTLNNLKVRQHPLNLKNKSDIKLKETVTRIIKKYKNKFNSSKNLKTSIFFGPPGGAIIEALENGAQAIHFPEDEIFDVYNNDLFPEIEVSELYKDVYKYSLNKKGKIFHLLKKKNKISKYI